jgi:hypothetical protein
VSVTSYPLFVPPEDLAARSIESWSVADANRYRDWLLGSMPDRVAVLKSTLSLPSGGTPESILLDAGRKMVGVLSEPAASTPGRREVADLRGHEITYDTGPLLTIHGYAIAADVGLLMAELLTDRYDLHWDVVISLVVTDRRLAVAADGRLALNVPFQALRRIQLDIERQRPATLVIVPEHPKDEPQVITIPRERYAEVANAVALIGDRIYGLD